MDRARIAEQERRLPSSSFLRLFQNEWTADEDRLTNLDDLAACVVLDGPLPPQPNVKYVIGVDIGLRRDRTVACVCHAERLDGRPLSAISDQMSMDADPFRGVRVVLDRIQVWAGSSDSPVQLAEVEVWLNEAVDIFNHARIVIDPWQAVGMAQRLRGRGVAVQEFNFTSASVGQSHQRSTSYSATAPLHCPTTRLCSTSLPMCDFERQHQASTGWTTNRTSTTTGLSP